MDAIKNVEIEVDKVLRLFSTCKEKSSNNIEGLVEIIERAKHQLNKLSTSNQNEINDQQASIIRSTCDMIQKTCSQVTNSHRELHVPVSKIGKNIDKYFSADFTCVYDTNLIQSPESIKSLNQAIAQHFLRNGMSSIGKEFVEEANLDVACEELKKFDEIETIVASLRRKDVSLALKWAIANRQKLRDINSPLEFKIHRMNIMDLYRQGIDKEQEIILYARENSQHLDPKYNLDILMGGLVYLKKSSGMENSGIENSPYKSFLDPINYEEIEDIFVGNACALLNLSIRSPIQVAVDAGCKALPALLNINQILSTQGVQNVWQSRDELPVEIDLGRDLQFHSTFSCPILKQQSTENNPPMRLVCGHVISREALNKMTNNGSNSNKLKCPLCPVEQVVSDAMQIHF